LKKRKITQIILLLVAFVIELTSIPGKNTFLNYCGMLILFWPYSKSKFEQNSKKSRTLCCKKNFVCLYLSFFALKSKLQVLKYEFCQKIGVELAFNWQNFAQV